MACNDLAEFHACEIAVLVQNRAQGIAFAEHVHDLKLFLAKRITDQIALNRERILHEARRVESPDGLMSGHAWRYNLGPTGPTGHEVWLNKPGRNAKICLREAPVNLHRSA